MDLGVEVWGIGFRVEGLEVGVQGIGCRGEGSGFRAGDLQLMPGRNPFTLRCREKWHIQDIQGQILA